MGDTVPTPGPDLPDTLAEEAAERLVSVDSLARKHVLAALVAAHPDHAVALARLAAELAAAERVLDRTCPDDALPAELGPYRVIRRLGEGAFGTVFLCEQRQPVQREVAVKVLRPGAGDRHTLARFELERQMLAWLLHPSIAQVFDAGALPDGRPFFVMEHVAGVSIRDYCDSRHLDVAHRVSLFLDLCRGVEHAHRRGIVHRDLKPANVLVVDSEGGPLPKIIDFGIAKALEAPSTDSSLRTETGRVVGTPGYMSPEQAEGRVADVDARADVFALGVMLYELLTGALPWNRGVGTDSDPPRPSTRVADTATSTGTTGTGTRGRRLAAALRGDLDWITLKALARERERRYQSVPELIADLERHRRGEPVSAGPPSLAYRVRKFVRRHRAATRAIAVSTIVAAIAIAIAREHGRRADARADDAASEASRAFDDACLAVERLLVRADDVNVRSAPASDALRQALVRDALAFYDSFVPMRPSDPALRVGRCRALLTLSQVHWLLGQFDRATASADTARVEVDALLETNPAETAYLALRADARRKRGRSLTSRGDGAGAHPEFVAAVADLERCFAARPDDHALSLSSALREFATTSDDALAGLDACRRSVQVLEDMLSRHPQSAAVRHDLVFASLGLVDRLVHGGDLDAADAAAARAEAGLAGLTSDREQAAAGLHLQRAAIARRRNDNPAVIRAVEACVAAARRWVAEQPQRVLPATFLADRLWDLGLGLDRAAAWDDATRALRESIEIYEGLVARFPEDPSRLVDLRNTLRNGARLLWDRFRRVDLDEAEAFARRAVEIDARLPPGKAADDAWQSTAVLAHVYGARGDARAAEAWEQVARSLPDPAVQPVRIEALGDAWVGIAGSRLSQGQLDAAAGAVEAASALIGDRAEFRNTRSDLLTLAAKIAAARRDHAAAAANATAIVSIRPSWGGQRRAAECLLLAWRVATGAGADAELANGYRDRAAEACLRVVKALDADVARDPHDPWHVLPWGFAHLQVAVIEADRGELGTAHQRVERALPIVEAVRDAAHSDQWDEALVEEVRRLLR